MILKVDFNMSLILTILVWPIRIGLRATAATAVRVSERRRRLGIGMVCVRSRGGANLPAFRFGELSAGSTDVRLTVAHVAGCSILRCLSLIGIYRIFYRADVTFYTNN